MDETGNTGAKTSEAWAMPFEGQSRPRILVADDETMILRLMVEALTKSGYEVTAAEDGARAWEALEAERYDLLITDNSMPNVTGVELVGLAREAGLAIPVIMASGSLPQEEFARRPSTKPTAFLLKPVSLVDLLDKVNQILHLHKALGAANQPPLDARPDVAWTNGRMS